MKNDDSSEHAIGVQTTWMPPSEPNTLHPHMTDEFAQAYELTANRSTGQIAAAALDRVGDVRWGTRVLDIAAGAGALAVPAALRGASVLAVDHAPGMINLLARKLAPFPTSEARLMDGQDLEIADDSFDASFSVLGVSIFPDWRRGLTEQARVTRRGGKACVATWSKPPGGGPFLIMARAIQSVFPKMQPPMPPEGFIVLSQSDRMAGEMARAGFSKIEVEEIDTVWEGPTGQDYLRDVGALHDFIGIYSQLDSDNKRRLDTKILRIVEELTVNDRVVLHTPALLGIGIKS